MLTTPATKQGVPAGDGVAGDEAGVQRAPDLDDQDRVDADQTLDRISFKLVLGNPGGKKVVSLPVRAGGKAFSGSIAVTIHTEMRELGSGHGRESAIVDTMPMPGVTVSETVQNLNALRLRLRPGSASRRQRQPHRQRHPAAARPTPTRLSFRAFLL